MVKHKTGGFNKSSSQIPNRDQGQYIIDELDHFKIGHYPNIIFNSSLIIEPLTVTIQSKKDKRQKRRNALANKQVLQIVMNEKALKSVFEPVSYKGTKEKTRN